MINLFWTWYSRLYFFSFHFLNSLFSYNCFDNFSVWHCLIFLRTWLNGEIYLKKIIHKTVYFYIPRISKLLWNSWLWNISNLEQIKYMTLLLWYGPLLTATAHHDRWNSASGSPKTVIISVVGRQRARSSLEQTTSTSGVCRQQPGDCLCQSLWLVVGWRSAGSLLARTTPSSALWGPSPCYCLCQSLWPVVGLLGTRSILAQTTKTSAFCWPPPSYCLTRCRVAERGNSLHLPLSWTNNSWSSLKWRWLIEKCWIYLHRTMSSHATIMLILQKISEL